MIFLIRTQCKTCFIYICKIQLQKNKNRVTGKYTYFWGAVTIQERPLLAWVRYLESVQK